MMGFQWCKFFVNEYEFRSVRKLRGKFGNDGRVFYTIFKALCYESEFGVITIENKIEGREIAERVGVTPAKLLKMIEFACTEACDWGKNPNGDAVEVPLFDHGLWREKNMIFCNGWLADMEEVSRKTEYGRERSRINSMNHRNKKKVEQLNEPETRNENSGSAGIFDNFD